VWISALAALAAARSVAPPAPSSDNLSLGFPNFEIWPNVGQCCDAETRSWYRSCPYPLLAWGCMGYGFLGDMDPSDADRRERVSRVYGSPRNRERLKRAGEAAASGLTRAQISWLWVLAQSLNLYPICGGHTIAQLKAAFALEGTTLSAAAARWLNLETDAPPEAGEILARSPSRPEACSMSAYNLKSPSWMDRNLVFGGPIM
jgi:hypothetical protein